MTDRLDGRTRWRRGQRMLLAIHGAGKHLVQRRLRIVRRARRPDRCSLAHPAERDLVTSAFRDESTQQTDGLVRGISRAQQIDSRPAIVHSAREGGTERIEARPELSSRILAGPTGHQHVKRKRAHPLFPWGVIQRRHVHENRCPK
jgi:hypothetical protein